MFLKNPIFSPTHCMYRAIPGSDREIRVSVPCDLVGLWCPSCLSFLRPSRGPTTNTAREGLSESLEVLV